MVALCIAGAPSAVRAQPTYPTVDWSVEGFYRFGNAGDMNGDGFEDLIVGAHDYGDAGTAFVYHGSARGLAVTPGTTLSGISSGDDLGWHVAGAGDTNGDGYDDVIVSSDRDAYTFHGSATGVIPTIVTTIPDHPGPVAGLGDTNADGYADIGLLGSLGVAVFNGSSTGTLATASLSVTPAHDVLSLAPAGDVNGDGFADMVLGCRDQSTHAERGYTYLYEGSATGVLATPSTSLIGETEDWGGAASGAGDVDGDGYDDVVIGAAGHDDFAGRVSVYRGGPDGLSADDYSWVDGSAKRTLGQAVAGAGDFDADGFDDGLVGTSWYGNGGDTFVFGGSPAGVASSPAVTIRDAPSDSSDVASGYFTGDGLRDIVVGASGDGRAGSAQVRVWYACVDADSDGFGAWVDCDDDDATIVPFALYTDSDGDGFGDPETETYSAVKQPTEETTWATTST